MVIRDGKACGLMIISGVIPLSVKGMFSAGHSKLNVPWADRHTTGVSLVGEEDYTSMSFAQQKQQFLTMEHDDEDTQTFCP